MKHNIAILLGTRPEIIKLSPVIQRLQETHTPFEILHSSQHFDPNMDAIFFRQFGLPKPTTQFHVGGKSRSEQIAQILILTTTYIEKYRPSILVVQGDTNTVLGGALAASATGLPIAHVEAGLRSFDRSMPEELNRVLCDHLAAVHFVPTNLQKSFLKQEGIHGKGVHVVGNTICDVLKNQRGFAQGDKKQPPYVLLTLHRPANVDDARLLRRILTELLREGEKQNLKIIFPVHPRTRKQLPQTLLARFANRFLITEPLGYHEFLALQKNASVIVTDSGGVQEEACILRVPCVTFRTTTERQETISAKANILCTRVEDIGRCVRTMLHVPRRWKQPYGNGRTSDAIVRVLQTYL